MSRPFLKTNKYLFLKDFCTPPKKLLIVGIVDVGEPAVLCLVTQLCPSLCDPTDCSLPGSSIHGDCPGKSTGVGCHALLQGIFPTQGPNPGLTHCRWILYHLSHEANPTILEWVAYPFSTASSRPRNLCLLHCRWILYQLSYQGSGRVC